MPKEFTFSSHDSGRIPTQIELFSSNKAEDTKKNNILKLVQKLCCTTCKYDEKEFAYDKSEEKFHSLMFK